MQTISSFHAPGRNQRRKKKGTNFSNQKNIHRHHGLISKSDIDTLRGRRMGAATPYMASAFNPVNHHPWPRRRCIRSSGLAKTIPCDYDFYHLFYFSVSYFYFLHNLSGRKGPWDGNLLFFGFLSWLNGVCILYCCL
jgi:hypothetical protein